MMNPSRWKVVVVALATLFGVFFTLPNLLPATVRDHLPAFLPHQTLKLGLDLQGGSSLLLSVDGDALRKERITNLIEDARSSLKEAGIAFTDLGQTGPDVTVRINDPSQIGPAMNALRKSVAPATQGAAGGREVSLGQAADQRIRSTRRPPGRLSSPSRSFAAASTRWAPRSPTSAARAATGSSCRWPARAIPNA